MTGRIEIWFRSGNMRCFPLVKWDTIKNIDGGFSFIFGKNEHEACVNRDSVEFVEFMSRNEAN